MNQPLGRLDLTPGTSFIRACSRARRPITVCLPSHCVDLISLLRERHQARRLIREENARQALPHDWRSIQDLE